MRHFFILFILGLFLTGCNDEKEQIACLESDKLRVQIGETIFAFPRKDIRDMAGRDVQWEGEPIYSDKVDADEICQKTDHPPLLFDQITLKMRPDGCVRDMHGSCSGFYGFMGVRNSNSQSDQIKLREDYIKKCKEKTYFNTCRHGVIYENLGFYFQYYLIYYPLKEVEIVEQLVIDYLKKHDITPKNTTSEERE